MSLLDSQLGAADVPVMPDVLDRIDEIVPPGTNLNRRTPAGDRLRSRIRRGGGAEPDDAAPAAVATVPG